MGLLLGAGALIAITAVTGRGDREPVRPADVATRRAHPPGPGPTPAGGREDGAIDDDRDPAATARAEATLAGTVTGPDDRPLAGATVDVLRLADSVHVTATTDAAGAWHADAVAAGRYYLTASSDAYAAPPGTVVELDGITPRTDVALHVPGGLVLAGDVVDAAGAPVPHAAIYIRQLLHDAEYERTADAQGRFALAGLAVGMYDVDASTDVLVGPPARADVFAARTEVHLVVEDTHIAGVIVDPDGKPIAGAYAIAGFAAARSDAHGHFELDGLRAGEYGIHAAWEHTTFGHDADLDVPVQTGTAAARLVLAPAAVLTGRVLLGGSPVPYFSVNTAEATRTWFLDEPVEVRAADGRFTRGALRAGTWRAEIIAPGAARQVLPDLHLVAGQTTDLGDIVLARREPIRGHVRDAAGAPVAGARVTLGGTRDPTQTLVGLARGSLVATTDATGAFGLDLVDDRARHGVIAASHPRLGASVPRLLRDDEMMVELTLAPTGDIDGLVEGYAGFQIGLGAFLADFPQGARATFVDITGHFAFEHLPPGIYVVDHSTTFGGPRLEPVTVTVVAGQRATATLRTPAITVTVVATVTGAACQMVELYRAPLEGSYAEPACDGDVATFSHIPPGAYRLCDRGPDCAPVVVTATPATQRIHAHLVP